MPNFSRGRASPENRGELKSVSYEISFKNIIKGREFLNYTNVFLNCTNVYAVSNAIDYVLIFDRFTLKFRTRVANDSTYLFFSERLQ